MHARPGFASLRGESLEDRCLLVVPDFQLVDVNTNSDLHDEMISPRDYMGRVSGWYFIHTT